MRHMAKVHNARFNNYRTSGNGPKYLLQDWSCITRSNATWDPDWWTRHKTKVGDFAAEEIMQQGHSFSIDSGHLLASKNIQ